MERTKREASIADLYADTCDFVRRNPYCGPGEPDPADEPEEAEPGAQ